jgi:hypothetical protein
MRVLFVSGEKLVAVCFFSRLDTRKIQSYTLYPRGTLVSEASYIGFSGTFCSLPGRCVGRSVGGCLGLWKHIGLFR